MKVVALIALMVLGLNAFAEPSPESKLASKMRQCLAELRQATEGQISPTASLILPDGNDSLVLRDGLVQIIPRLDLSNWNTKIALSDIEDRKAGRRSVGLNVNGTLTYYNEPPGPGDKEFEAVPVSSFDESIQKAINSELRRVGDKLSNQQKGRIYHVCKILPEAVAHLPKEWPQNENTLTATSPAPGSSLMGGAKPSFTGGAGNVAR